MIDKISNYKNPQLLTHNELHSALNELLEAERAGARATLETAQQLIDIELINIVTNIQIDEIRWCKMLIKLIRGLDVPPSTKTGEFYDKAIAISDTAERLIFINRGQSWVVKRLQILIPRINEISIRENLQIMLEAHQENIQNVEKVLNKKSK